MHFVEKLENDLTFCHLYHCQHHMYISFQLLCVFVSLWKSSPVVHNISELILKINNTSQTFFALTQIPLCHHFWLGLFWQAVGRTPQCVGGEDLPGFVLRPADPCASVEAGEVWNTRNWRPRQGRSPVAGLPLTSHQRRRKGPQANSFPFLGPP